MSYQVRKRKKSVEIVFDGFLTGSSVKKIIEEFDATDLQAFETIYINLSQVTTADGSAMTSLVSLHRLSRKSGCKLKINKSSKEIRSLLRVLNLHKLIPLEARKSRSK